MKTISSHLVASLAFVLAAAGGCVATSPTTTTSQRAIIDTPCATSADCPAGLECEVSTSTCKAHGGH